MTLVDQDTEKGIVKQLAAFFGSKISQVDMIFHLEKLVLVAALKHD